MIEIDDERQSNYFSENKFGNKGYYKYSKKLRNVDHCKIWLKYRKLR